MLPACRTDGDIYRIPKFMIETRDVKDFMHELKGFHEEFRDCFSRSEPLDNFFRYMVGQFCELERKSIEPIALNVEGGKVRAMQYFISNTVWDEKKMLHIYRTMVNDDMGDQNGVLIFDESGFEKKGHDSVGVTRQYLSGLDKTANGQIGVFAAYASPHGYALIDKHLYMPKEWFSAEYEEKRKKCKVPKNVAFRTKAQLAVDMFQDIYEEKTIPFKYVVADKVYGQSPEFMEKIESHPELTYFLSIDCDTLIWLERPITKTKEYKYRGEIRTKYIVEKTTKKPISVKEFAENLNDFFWYKRTVSEGTKGPIEYEFTKRRVVIAKNKSPSKTVWLIIKRTLDDKPVYKYYISNALMSTRLKTFVWLSGLRWPIEQCFEETKTDLGMDQYEVRIYQGWNHHMLITMLAHFFLWHQKIKLEKKSTSYYYISA